MGLQADPSEPVPLEVRVVRPLPVEVLTANLSLVLPLTAWRTARGFAQGCHGCVVSHPVCWGEASPLSLQPCVLFLLGTHWQPAFTRPFLLGALCHGIRLAGFWGRQSCEPLGQHCHPMMPHWVWGLDLLGGRGHPDRAAPGCLPSRGDEHYGGSVNLSGARLRA